MNLIIIIAIILMLLYIAGIITRSRRARNKTISIIQENCIGCKRCVKCCHRDVLDVVDKQVILIDLNKCTACGDCVAICKYDALVLIDREA